MVQRERVASGSVVCAVQSETALVHALQAEDSVLVKAVLTLRETPVSLLMSVLLDHKARSKWDSLFTVVKQLDSSPRPPKLSGMPVFAIPDSNVQLLGDESSHVVYFQLKKQMAISPRDVCQLWTIRKHTAAAAEQQQAERSADSTLEFTIVHQDEDHPDATPPPGSVRIQTGCIMVTACQLTAVWYASGLWL